MIYEDLESELNLCNDLYNSMDKGIWIFGAANLGMRLNSFCKGSHIDTIGFVDNNPSKTNSCMMGKRVYSFSEFCQKYDGELIVIAVNKAEHEVQIKDQLSEILGDNIYAISYLDFMDSLASKYCWVRHKELVTRVCQISLTERCTLKCKKCAHACNLVKMDSMDLELNKVLDGIDLFFDIWDYIDEFVLLGGEPLLYKQLASVVEYLGEKYRDKIGVFSITTNGTIVPDNNLLVLCKKYMVKYRVSDYSPTIPKLKDRYSVLIDTFERNDVKYELETVYWVDFGFDWVDRGESEDVLKFVFNECKTPCRELRENRLYFCMMGRSISENMGYNIGVDDYIDLERVIKSESNGKQECLRYNLGILDKGFIDMCRHCNGKDAFQYPIVPAEQM